MNEHNKISFIEEKIKLLEDNIKLLEEKIVTLETLLGQINASSHTHHHTNSNYHNLTDEWFHKNYQ